MLQRLFRFYSKDFEPTDPLKVRQAYGMLCGIVGIFFNLLLFLGKCTAGMISNSIAITADAFNNLADSASSLITLVGFKLSGQEADSNHPFGHGRVEYLCGLMVSCAILFMGYELILSSCKKILSPQNLKFSLPSLLILLGSILVKLFMAFFHLKIGKRIESPALKAVAADSISDMIATFVVLLAGLTEHFFHWNIDGICGVIVGLFILYTGFTSAKDTITPLLGPSPAAEFVERIQQIVLSTEGVLGMHDLIVHDYGPGRLLISLHAEVSAEEKLLEIHHKIDQLEQLLNQQLNCEAVIHMDPVIVSDPEVEQWRERISTILFSLDPSLHFHDFRIIRGNTHTSLIFDMVLPYHYKMSKSLLLESIQEKVWEYDTSCKVAIQMEHSYV